MTESFQQFPQLMQHPGFRAATIDAYTDEKPPRLIANGQAMRFPPVTVHDQQQYDYHEAQGYRPSGRQDPRAFAAAKAVSAEEAVGVGWQEYPKMVGGVVVRSEDEEEERRAAMVEEAAAAERTVEEAARLAAAQPADLQSQVTDLRSDMTEIKAALALLLDQATTPKKGKPG